MSETLAYLLSSSLTDSVSILESDVKSFVTAKSDTASLSDQEVLLSSKSLTDQTSVTEAIDVNLLVAARGFVLNTRALNTSVLN